MRGRSAALALFASLFAAACASPLRAPPPALEEIRGAAERDTSAPPEPAALWERRPDRGAVRAAAAGYMDAALSAEAAPGERRGALVGAARAYAWLAEHEPQRERRGEHAAQALRTAQHCARDFPGDGPCRYWLGIGLGLSARERPSRGIAAVNEMIELLLPLADESPRMERGGPDRVLALVFLRAPGWPTGPGSLERALQHAERAAGLDAQHPPNLLAFAEALAEDGRGDEARAMRERALAAAQMLVLEGDPDAPEWVRSARNGLAAARP